MMYIPHIFIAHSSGGHLGCLHFLVTVKRMNMAMQVSVEEDAESLGYMPRSGIAGDSTFVFSFLRILHTDFQRAWTSLKYH